MSMVDSHVRIALVDDHATTRAGIRAWLEDMPRFEVVGEAGDGEEALTLAERLCPDMMLVDISMPRMNGIDLIKELHLGYPDIRVLVHSMFNNPQFVNDALQNGARGYVLKDEKASDLIRAIERVADGEIYFTRSINMISPPLSRLTNTELKVITLVAEGKSTKEIAAQFRRAVSTIDAHRLNISRKLKTDNVADWARYVIRRGWLEGYSYAGPEQE